MLLKRGREIGIKSGDLYVKASCINCGLERWVKKADFDAGKQQYCKKCYLAPKIEGDRKRILAEHPDIKDVKHSSELGKSGDCLYVLVECPECGKPKWMRKSAYERGINLLCRSCGGRQGMNKRGRYGCKKHQGYVMVTVHPNDPMRVMAHKSGWVLEHRLIMARHLGRPLLKGEQVHHRPDVAKDDNRIEGLYLMPDLAAHARLLPCANCELKKEIRLLRWQIKEQNEQIKNLTSLLMLREE